MRSEIILLAIMIAAAASSYMPAPAAAASFEVAPTTIEIAAGTNTGILYVTNRGAESVAVQIEPFDWQQADAADRLEASHTLLVSPPMAHIAPGARQTIRLMVKPDANARGERAFRLLVSQLPDPKAKPIKGVRVLLQFSVPVFANVVRTEQARLAWETEAKGKGLSLIARNSGARHAKLSGLTLIAPTNRRIEIVPKKFRYVLAGASQSWNIAGNDVGAGETLRIEGRDESAGAPIMGSLVVRR